MKVCPVCGSRTFDDAETCYGCLYRFDQEQTGTNGAVANSADMNRGEPGGSKTSSPSSAGRHAVRFEVDGNVIGSRGSNEKDVAGVCSSRQIVSDKSVSVTDRREPRAPSHLKRDEEAASAGSSGWTVRFEAPGHLREFASCGVGAKDRCDPVGEPPANPFRQNSSNSIVICIQPPSTSGDRLSELVEERAVPTSSKTGVHRASPIQSHSQICEARQ